MHLETSRWVSPSFKALQAIRKRDFHASFLGLYSEPAFTAAEDIECKTKYGHLDFWATQLHTHSLVLSHSHTRTHTLSLTHAHTHSLSHTRTHTLSPAHKLTHAQAQPSTFLHQYTFTHANAPTILLQSMLMMVQVLAKGTVTLWAA